jgi:hypothetical protein
MWNQLKYLSEGDRLDQLWVPYRILYEQLKELDVPIWKAQKYMKDLGYGSQVEHLASTQYSPGLGSEKYQGYLVCG